MYTNVHTYIYPCHAVNISRGPWNKNKNARCALTIRWITNDHLSFLSFLPSFFFALVHVICFYWVRLQMCFDQPYCSIFFFSFRRYFYLLRPRMCMKDWKQKKCISGIWDVEESMFFRNIFCTWIAFEMKILIGELVWFGWFIKSCRQFNEDSFSSPLLILRICDVRKKLSKRPYVCVSMMRNVVH